MPVLHTFKGKNGSVTERLGPAKAIRRFCAECYGWSNWEKEVKGCLSMDCPLYPFRLGKDPSRKQDMTPEQRKAVADGFRESRKHPSTQCAKGQNS